MNFQIWILPAVLLGFLLPAPAAARGEDGPVKTGLLEIKASAFNSFYLLDVPEDYTDDRTWPLLVSLHGSGDYARDYVGVWQRLTRKNGYFLAVPNGDAKLPVHQGEQRTWSGRSLQFILNMISEIQKRYRIHPDRIYLNGFSAGASLTYYLGLQNPQTFAAIVPCAGALPRSLPPAMIEKARDLPVYVCAGKKDRGFRIIVDSARRLQAQGMKNVLIREFPDLGHNYPHRENPKIIVWFDQLFEKKLKSMGLDSWLSDARRALKEESFGWAVSLLLSIRRHGLTSKAGEEAEDLLLKAEEAGFSLLQKAQEQAQAGKTAEALKILISAQLDFKGLDCAGAARDVELSLCEDLEVRRRSEALRKEEVKRRADLCRNWLALAKAMERKKEDQKAVSLYRKIVAVSPDSETGRKARARIHELK